MSIAFNPEPPLAYDRFVSEVKGILLLPVEPPVYVGKHMIMKLNGNNIFVYEDEQGVAFERFGRNRVGEMFRLIEAQFGVHLISYYELHWAEDND